LVSSNARMTALDRRIACYWTTSQPEKTTGPLSTLPNARNVTGVIPTMQQDK
jgi:hypothetical protein